MNRFLGTEIGNKELDPIGLYWQHSLLSLEQALEPVKSRFDQLDRSIREVKNHCHYPSQHQLTQDESAAILLYTMEGGGDNNFYRVLNETLRSANRRAVAPWFGFLKLFDTALAKLPPVSKSVWRSLKGDISEQFVKDGLLTWWSITSCSTSPQAAQKFLKGETKSTLLMIEAKNGKDVSSYSSYPDEKEVILRPGTHLRVEDNAAHYPGGLVIVHLVKINDDEYQLEKSKTTKKSVKKPENKSAAGATQPVVESLPKQHRKPHIILES